MLRQLLRRRFGPIYDVLTAGNVPVSHILGIPTQAVGALNSCVLLLGHCFGEFDGEAMCFRISRLLGELHLTGHLDRLLDRVVLLAPVRALRGWFVNFLDYLFWFVAFGSTGTESFVLKDFSSYDTVAVSALVSSNICVLIPCIIVGATIVLRDTLLGLFAKVGSSIR